MSGKYSRSAARMGLFIALFVSTITCARADLKFTLTRHDVMANPGQTITFLGLLQNTGNQPLFLNSDFGIVDQPLGIDDTQFLTEFLLPQPQPALTVNGKPIKAELFDVSLPA